MGGRDEAGMSRPFSGLAGEDNISSLPRVPAAGQKLVQERTTHYLLTLNGT